MSLDKQEEFFEEFSTVPSLLKQEVIDFFYFVKSRHSEKEEDQGLEDSQMLDSLSKSSTFAFLKEEKDLYTLDDAEEVYS